MPWVVVDGLDNHHGLMPGRRRSYGAARPELAASCAHQRLPLETFPWAPQYARAGLALARDALYLLRPDTYVGLADETGSADVPQSYSRRGPMAN
jgi:hypothetical protein